MVRLKNQAIDQRIDFEVVVYTTSLTLSLRQVFLGTLHPVIHVEATRHKPSTPSTLAYQWHQHILMRLVLLAEYCVMPHHKHCSGTA